MADVPFWSLLADYRSRAADPDTGRSLTQKRLAESLSAESRQDVSPSTVGRWERGEVPFPDEQRELALALLRVLARYGGIKSASEADRLLGAADYKPLSPGEEDALFGPVIHSGVQKQADPSVGDAGNGAGSGAVEPDDSVRTERLGVEIEVALTERGWRLPVQALVLAPGQGFANAGGRFYEAMLDDLGSSAAAELASFFKQTLPSKVKEQGPEVPVALPLPADLAGEVLPHATPQDRAMLVMGNWTAPDDRFEEVTRRFVGRLVQLAQDEGIESLAMPIYGTRGGERPETTAARPLLEAWLSQRSYGSLKRVVILTIEPGVLDVARAKFRMYGSNRAQRLWNDEPSAEDLLGIEPEVRALTETLLMKDIRPPMAVGILGGWGSGKSTVMRLMQQRMTRYRLKRVKKGWPAPEASQDDPDWPAFVGHIYQICFNAWTYAKSNLWASLMQQIFFELNRQLSWEQQLADQGFPALEGGDIYQLLYPEQAWVAEKRPDQSTYDQLVATTGDRLWRTLRTRREDVLKDLHKVKEEVAQLKADRGAAEQERQKKVLDSLGDEGQQVASRVLLSVIQGLAEDALTESARKALEEGGGLDEAEMAQQLENLRGLRATARRLWQVARQGGWMTAGFLLFALLCIYGGILISLLIDLSGLQRLLTVAASFVPLLLPTLRVAARWGKRVDGIVDEYQRLAQSQREVRQAMWTERMEEGLAADAKEVQQVLSATEGDEQRRRQELERLAAAGSRNLVAYDRLLETKEAEAEQLRRRAGPTAEYVSLIDFVQARQDEGFYENKLGLMHQVKRDIDELTAGLTIHAQDPPDVVEGKKKLFPRGEPRVFLFIDDLDRCPPPRVVQVMEAVQLLLRTELFIVVLGLDTRYITRALEKEYREILQHEGDPSGLDYIEKILQIPYRVRPVEPQHLGDFLERQMDFVEEQVPSGREQAAQEPPSGEDETPGDEEGSKEPGPPEHTPPPSPAQTEKEESQPEEEIPPEVVKFGRDDLLDLTTCCRQVNLTPRSIKRLINVLKLVKIFWFREDGRDPDRTVRQTVIALLALAAAYPEIMREAFAELDTRLRDPDRGGEDTIAQFLRTFPLADALHSVYAWQLERFRADVKALERVQIDADTRIQFKLSSDQMALEFCTITLSDLTTSTFNLVRSFSFVGDPSYAIDSKEWQRPERQTQEPEDKAQ
jgi:transcriptional regulator with XRE-family HTH domain